jgi:adenosine deaminase
MLDFLYEQYTVTGRSPLRVTLHAGELTDAVLPPGSTDDTFHIAEAVRTAHAERIGHGIDILSETGSDALLDEMAEQQVLVEVCLSSNDQILEIRGESHPLEVYLERGVPIALATDDQGVSRSSMAGEYTRAVRDQGFRYRDLKTAARQSLEHAFLPGASLWASVADGTMIAACLPLADPPSAPCQAVLDASARAEIQYELERRFWAFERVQP